jgi:uncharacterized protein with ParB-like and HNH nuclease domain
MAPGILILNGQNFYIPARDGFRRIFEIAKHGKVRIMPYQSDTIANIINRLNIQYFMPDIQREFVWHQEQVVKLFDSIMRGYPISSFLFWEVKQENRYSLDIYKFTDNYIQDSKHNDKAFLEGVLQPMLVLDGQQRLTSLLIGLKGSYTIKKKYLRYDDPRAWVAQRLYLDLMKDPKATNQFNDEDIHYGLKFFEFDPKSEDGHHWFQVGHILDFDDDDNFDEFKSEENDRLPDNTTKKQEKLVDMNLDRLYRAIWKNAVISYYVETDQDYDRILDIFIRANDGGTKLSKSDLLLSMVTSKFKGFNAREEIYDFVDRLNKDLPRRNNFDKDFIMKACLVLSDLPVQYKISNFSNQNLALIEKDWTSIKDSIERGVSLVNTFGIDRDTLTSANALIPIIYYLFWHQDTNLVELTPSNVRNASRIRTWLTAALLNNVFGGQSDQVLTEARNVLKDNRTQEDYPVGPLNNEISKMHRNTFFDETTIEDFLWIKYGRQQTFLALSLLYDDNKWGTISFQQDHIFPRALFTQENMDKAGISSDRQKDYLEWMNCIGNLQLLLPKENQEKLAQPFDIWIHTRDVCFKKRHMIPLDESLYKFEKFDEFVMEREAFIGDRLKDLFAPSSINEGI